MLDCIQFKLVVPDLAQVPARIRSFNSLSTSIHSTRATIFCCCCPYGRYCHATVTSHHLTGFQPVILRPDIRFRKFLFWNTRWLSDTDIGFIVTRHLRYEKYERGYVHSINISTWYFLSESELDSCNKPVLHNALFKMKFNGLPLF